jgi:hypothetical protein
MCFIYLSSTKIGGPILYRKVRTYSDSKVVGTKRDTVIRDQAPVTESVVLTDPTHFCPIHIALLPWQHRKHTKSHLCHSQLLV